MQRLHMDDLTGMLLRSSDDWTLLSLSAIAEQEEKIQIGEEEHHIRVSAIFSTLSGCRDRFSTPSVLSMARSLRPSISKLPSHTTGL
jgi:hypothetical protein